MNLLNYVPGDSFLHKLNPVTKLAAAFMYGIAAILCENVFAEVPALNLILTDKAVDTYGSLAKVLPPLIYIKSILRFLNLSTSVSSNT